MCGIIGYIGEQNAVPVLVDGLERLEYRGYDSAGIAFLQEDQILVRKAAGKIQALKETLQQQDQAYLGIGHTRWATHGVPSTVNAHPHLSMDEDIAVIHNGIIENYRQLKTWLMKKGVVFRSDTDTEVIAHLLSWHYQKKPDLLCALHAAVKQMEGAYAIAVIARKHPEELVAVRKDSPLILGLGEKENFLASDVPAILKHTKRVIYLENGEYARLRTDGVEIFDRLMFPVQREEIVVDWDIQAAQKEGYEHFTLKEIHEQPKAIQETIKRHLQEEADWEEILKDAKRFDKVVISACGTAFHAGLTAKHLIEDMANLPVQVEIASEFRYGKQFINDRTLFIAISQSGETIDTLQALRKAKEGGAKTLALLNVLGSSMARESDAQMYTWAGPEIGVASTKAYTTQLVCLLIMAMKLAKARGFDADLVPELVKLPEQALQCLAFENQLRQLAYDEFHQEMVVYIGRGLEVATAMEASLKLKEISYINSLAMAAGELKHGSIALIEPGTLVFAFLGKRNHDKMISNIQEVRARGARTVLVAAPGVAPREGLADVLIELPDCDERLMPILSILPAQLFAYYVSLARGLDVDKPRNLAKSVTVE